MGISWDSGKRGYLKLECDDGTTLSDWGESGTNIRSAVLTRQLSEGETLAIGGVCPAEVTLTMEQSVSSGTEFLLSLGQETDGAITWQAMGRFTARSCVKEGTFYRIQASDALAGLEETFTGSGETLEAALAALCEQAGLTLSETVTLPEISLPAIPEGLTLRLLLGYLAALWGGNALLDEEGELVFRWYADRSGQAEAGESYEGSWSLKTESRSIEALRFSVPTETENGLTSTSTIERTTGASGVTLAVENPLATEENVETAWQRVQGFSYEMGELVRQGIPEVTAGDCLTVTETDETTHKLPITLHKLEYDGGLKSTLSAPSQTAEEESTTHQGAVGRQLSTLSAEIGRFESIYADYVEAAEGRFTTLETEKLTADRIDIDDLFAQDITATGTISGATLEGGTITGTTITGTTITGTTVTGGTISGAALEGGTITGTTISGTTVTGGTITGATLKGSEIIYTQDIDGEENTAGRIYFDNGIQIETEEGLPLYYSAGSHQFTGPIYAGSSLYVGGDAAVSGDIYLDNDKSVCGTNTSGTALKNFEPCNSSNNCVLGYGSFMKMEGATHIYGHQIYFDVGEDIYYEDAGDTPSPISFKPYYCAGDSITVDWRGGGYITGSKTSVIFPISLAKPVIGSPTVTVTSKSGLKVRQAGKYLYATSGYAVPSSFIARLSGDGSWINVFASMANTTNVTYNNAPAGVEASLIITFS